MANMLWTRWKMIVQDVILHQINLWRKTLDAATSRHSWSGKMTIINHHRKLTSLGAMQWPILDVFFLPCDLKYCYWDVTVSDKYLLLKLQWKLGVPRDSHFLSLDSRNFCEREQIQSARTAFFLFPLMCSWHWVWMKASPDYELKKQKRRAKESQRS